MPEIDIPDFQLKHIVLAGICFVLIVLGSFPIALATAYLFLKIDQLERKIQETELRLGSVVQTVNSSRGNKK